MRDIVGIVAQCFFNTQELVVFGDAFGARDTAGFEDPAVGGDAQVGDEGVLGLAGTVTDHGDEAVSLSDADGLKGLGEGSDLIGFDDYSVGGVEVYAPLQEARAGDEEVIAQHVDILVSGGISAPCVPVILLERVFDGKNGIIFKDSVIEVRELVAFEREPFAAQFINLVVGAIEFAGGAIHGNEKFFARHVTDLGDGGHDEVEGFCGMGDLRGEPALVDDGGGESLFVEDGPHGVSDFA